MIAKLVCGIIILCCSLGAALVTIQLCPVALCGTVWAIFWVIPIILAAAGVEILLCWAIANARD